MDSSSINLPPPPSPPPLSPPPPHPGVSHPHLSPFPPLLDLGESSAARPCKHKHDGFLHGEGGGGDHRRPRFQHYTPGLTPFPSPSSSSSSPKPRPRQKPPDMAGSAAGNTSTPPCTECGKRFSSWKALFGHMRCHPERQWRGINPPPHLRRPPQLLLPGPSPQPDDSEEDEYEMASCLLLLSRGSPRAGASEARGGGCSYESGSSSLPPPLTATRGGKNTRGWKRSWEKRSPVVKHRKRWKCAEEDGGTPNGSKRTLLDLNLPPPPPMDNNKGSSSSAVLDLRLGI